MKIYRRHTLAAGTQLIAALVVLGAGGPVSCHASRLNLTATGNSVSREVLPIDENAARYANLYDAIEHLRPEYLRVREQGPTQLVPVAYVNGFKLADPTMLRLVMLRDVKDVRWVRPNLTSISYGASHHIGGGIFVSTR
jgi:hypothetical protein